jgi:hypothetical protein
MLPGPLCTAVAPHAPWPIVHGSSATCSLAHCARQPGPCRRLTTAQRAVPVGDRLKQAGHGVGFWDCRLSFVRLERTMSDGRKEASSARWAQHPNPTPPLLLCAPPRTRPGPQRMNALDNEREGRATDMLLNYETVSKWRCGPPWSPGNPCRALETALLLAGWHGRSAWFHWGRQRGSAGPSFAVWPLLAKRLTWGTITMEGAKEMDCTCLASPA